MEKIKIMLVLVSMFTVTATFAQRTDFSGNWKINLQKSEFGNVPAYTANKAIKLTQLSDQLILEGTTIDDNGRDSTSAQKLKLNGVSTVVQVANHTVKKIRVNFSSDGQSFQEEMLISNNESGKNLVELITVWSISSDKKTLNLVTHAEYNDGKEYTTKAVYDKE